MGLQGRHIVLREFTPLLNRLITPDEKYLSGTDGSLPAESFLLRVDKNGFLETGNAQRGNIPIYILGDSFSEAIFEHEEERFSSILERNLLNAGQDVRVLNGSFSRASSLHMLNVLVNKVLQRDVQAGTTVILFRPQIDVQVTDVRGSYWNEYGLYSPLHPTVFATDEMAHTEPHDLDSSQRIFETIVDICVNFGIRLILGTAPARQNARNSDPIIQSMFTSDEAWRTCMQDRATANDQVRFLAQKRSLMLIDADRHFVSSGKGLYDFTHMNRDGQRMLADLVTTALLA